MKTERPITLAYEHLTNYILEKSLVIDLDNFEAGKEKKLLSRCNDYQSMMDAFESVYVEDTLQLNVFREGSDSPIETFIFNLLNSEDQIGYVDILLFGSGWKSAWNNFKNKNL